MIRVCLERGCPSPATYRGRCQAHYRERERERGSGRIYDLKRWKMLRRRKLFLNSLCERCGDIARDVHHRQDVKAGGDPWALENLESLCHSCHSKATARGEGRQ